MDTRYSNPGKVLREWFPEQTLTQGTILLWTLIYLLNLAAVLLVQYHLVYTILPPDNPFDDRPLFQLLQEKERFEGYEFLDVEHNLEGIQILCRNEEGEKVIVTLKQHSFFYRYRLTAGETPVTDGKRIDMDGWGGSQYLVVNGNFITENGGVALFQWNGRDVVPAMLTTLIPFLLEILIYNRIRALLR